MVKALKAYERLDNKKWTDDCWDEFLEDLCSYADINLPVRKEEATEKNLIRMSYLKRFCH